LAGIDHAWDYFTTALIGIDYAWGLLFSFVWQTIVSEQESPNHSEAKVALTGIDHAWDLHEEAVG